MSDETDETGIEVPAATVTLPGAEVVPDPRAWEPAAGPAPTTSGGVRLDGADICADLPIRPSVPEQGAGPDEAGEQTPTGRTRRPLPPPPPAKLAATAETVAVAPRPVLAPAPLTFSTLGRAWRVLVETVADELDGRERLWSLEAGAGPRTLFDLPEDAFIVGVDRDAGALEANLRLDERVVADLADYQPWAAGFDLVTCWYVLDGMPEPAPVLDRFASWTATGGLVVLGLPNAHSLRGWWSRVTRHSPLRGSLTPAALRRRFAAAGFTPILQVYYEDADHAQARRGLGLTGRRWKVAQALVRMATLGVLDAARTDYLVVFRREG